MTDLRNLLGDARLKIEHYAAYREEQKLDTTHEADLLSRIDAALAENVEPVADWCNWMPDDDSGDTWKGDCGILWMFNDDGPSENGVKFCHNCGKQVALPLPALPEGDK